MLIIDMPMPPHCADCFLHMDGNWDDGCGFCAGVPIYMDDDCRPNYEKRPSWCPIKGELPDEHGDLIDKETARNAFDSSFLTFRMKDGETMRGFYQRTIDELPVLIAAERKDDDRTERIHFKR